MNEAQLTAIIATIALVLLSFGVAYALLIYYRPFGRGWTWASVVLGVAITEILIWQAIFAYVDTNGFTKHLFWFEVVGFFLSGGPMIVGQLIKYFVVEPKHNAELEHKHNGPNNSTVAR